MDRPLPTADANVLRAYALAWAAESAVEGKAIEVEVALQRVAVDLMPGRRDDRLGDVYFALGHIFWYTSRPQAAEIAFRTAARSYRDNPGGEPSNNTLRAHANEALSMRQMDKSAADVECEVLKFKDVVAHSQERRLIKGMILYALGLNNAAKLVWAKIVREQPESPAYDADFQDYAFNHGIVLKGRSRRQAALSLITIHLETKDTKAARDVQREVFPDGLGAT